MSYAYVDSAFVSDKYRIFCELGYPQLDVQFFEDGSWAILEMLNAPLIPSMTKFKYILKGIENVEFSRSFVEKFVKQLDPAKGFFWEREDRLARESEEQGIKGDEFIAELAADTMKKLAKCDTLTERLAKNGADELTPERLAFNIYKDSPAKARELGINFEKVTK